MAGHTKGPWHVCPDDATQVRDADDDLVADCRRFTYTDDGEIDCPDNEGNARLAAASPEMLDALRDTMRALDELFSRDGKARHYAGAQAKWVKRSRGIISAAITKATGAA